MIPSCHRGSKLYTRATRGVVKGFSTWWRYSSLNIQEKKEKLKKKKKNNLKIGFLLENVGDI
jgi:hypothetical protein